MNTIEGLEVLETQDMRTFQTLFDIVNLNIFETSW